MYRQHSAVTCIVHGTNKQKKNLHFACIIISNNSTFDTAMFDYTESQLT